MTTAFLEHENFSFSKVLLSKEVSDIIKQVVRESTQDIHPPICNERKEGNKKLNLNINVNQKISQSQTTHEIS